MAEAKQHTLYKLYNFREHRLWIFSQSTLSYFTRAERAGGRILTFRSKGVSCEGQACKGRFWTSATKSSSI